MKASESNVKSLVDNREVLIFKVQFRKTCCMLCTVYKSYSCDLFFFLMSAWSYLKSVIMRDRRIVFTVVFSWLSATCIWLIVICISFKNVLSSQYYIVHYYEDNIYTNIFWHTNVMHALCTVEKLLIRSYSVCKNKIIFFSQRCNEYQNVELDGKISRR